MSFLGVYLMLLGAEVLIMTAVIYFINREPPTSSRRLNPKDHHHD